MSISVETNKNSYSGNGSTTIFAYAFKINDDDHLEVIVADDDDNQTTLTKTTHYTVSGVGEDSGGNVTTEDLTAICGETNLPSDWTITINRSVPLTQLTDLANQGAFAAETHEDVFDYLTMIAQQQQEELDRCPKVSITSGDDGDAYDDVLAGYATSAAAAQTAAETAQTAAETAETNAETAQTNAETAQTAAEAAQTAAETAETNAAASAAAAADSAAAGMYDNVQDKTANYTITEDDEGDLIRVDTTSGNITVTLPDSSGLTDDFKIAVSKKSSDSNTVTIEVSGSDTLNGGSSVQIGNQYNSYTLICDTATNTWLGISNAPSVGSTTIDRFSGDGVTTQFTLSTAPGTENTVFAFISGVYQQKDTFSVSGTTLTFDTAPASGTDNIEVAYTRSIDVGTPSDGTVTTAKIADDAVTSAKIADNAVVNAAMAVDSVNTDEIVDSAVTTVKLNADAVDGTKIADDAVDSEHITDDAVDAEHINGLTGTGAVDTDNIAEGSSNLYNHGWQLLATHTASNSSSIDITSSIDSNYDEYMIVISNMVVATDDTDLHMLVSLDNGSTWKSGDSDYSYANEGKEQTGTELDDHATSAAFMLLSSNAVNNGIGNGTGESYNAKIHLLNPNSSSLYFMVDFVCNYLNLNARLNNYRGTNLYRGATSAVDAVQLSMSSGNITSGTFKVYGLIKS